MKSSTKQTKNKKRIDYTTLEALSLALILSDGDAEKKLKQLATPATIYELLNIIHDFFYFCNDWIDKLESDMSLCKEDAPYLYDQVCSFYRKIQDKIDLFCED